MRTPFANSGGTRFGESLAFPAIELETAVRRAWHQKMRLVRITPLLPRQRFSCGGLNARGDGEVRFKQAPKVPSRHQSIVLRPAVRRLPPLSDHPLRRRLHVPATGSIPLFQVLPSSARRHLV